MIPPKACVMASDFFSSLQKYFPTAQFSVGVVAMAIRAEQQHTCAALKAPVSQFEPPGKGLRDNEY